MLYNSIEWNVFIFIPYFICQKHGENETKLKQEKTFHYASDLNNFTLIILCYELFIHDFISKLLQIWLPMSISKPAPHIKGHKDHLFSHKTYDPQPFFWDRWFLVYMQDAPGSELTTVSMSHPMLVLFNPLSITGTTHRISPETLNDTRCDWTMVPTRTDVR